MTPQQFVAKWSDAKLSERAAYQAHFNDLCELFGHPKPTELGATDEEFCFEKSAARAGKKAKGWADVWKRDAFAWEYKGAHKDLDEAYAQLLRYHDDLGNVPVLVVCDLQTIIVRVKRTNRATIVRTILLESLGAFPSSNFEFLKRAFLDPQNLESGEEIELITQSVAARLGEVADSLKARYPCEDERIARFLDRIVFGFFAEDSKLLPKGVLQRILESGQSDAARVSRQIAGLFEAMRSGGDFGTEEIRHFNGSLFDDLAPPLALTASECRVLLEASRKNWAEIDPSIFGTLFERSLDDEKRSQLGAHYTSRADIETLVEPVVLAPLRAEWDAVQTQLALQTQGEEAKARAILEAWLSRLEGIRVLDPACGSGNFLYVALERLLDLEKRARIWAEDNWGEKIEGRIRPEHFLGIELNIYAHDLAQIVVWIGFLQWQRANGYPFPLDPILRHTNNIQHCDALLSTKNEVEAIQNQSDSTKNEVNAAIVIADSATVATIEREWPAAEFIIGNPPFLGDKKMRGELGDDYVDALRIYRDRLPGTSNFVCYWFEKARAQIESGQTKRVGLVSTATIVQSNTRAVLERINQSGKIFFAVSNQPWILKGANLRVALIAFDNGDEAQRVLNGTTVSSIHSNLTAGLDLTRKRQLAANRGQSFMGTTKVGDYDISLAIARRLLAQPNVNGRPTSDVLRPYRNGDDLTQQLSNRWIIDFGTSISESDAALYDAPFEYLVQHVKAERQKNNRPIRARRWWLLGETLPAFRTATQHLTRYIATSGVSEHRIFVWLDTAVLPDAKVIAFAYDDDYHFGILQSKVHTLWANSVGGRHGVGNTPTYNPTECFGTFPFPDSIQAQPAISEAAAILNERRENWLHPPADVREEIVTFRASLDGPWQYRIQNPDARGFGEASWSKFLFKEESNMGSALKQERTLTGLYNARPQWLQSAHAALDAAVLRAYGLDESADDNEILAHLLELNLSRSGAEKSNSTS